MIMSPPLSAELDRAWAAVDLEISQAAPRTIQSLLRDEGDARFERLVIDAAGLHIDLTRQRLPLTAAPALADLLEVTGVERWRDAMFAGEAVNLSERRAALHTALRAGGADLPPSASLVPSADLAPSTAHPHSATLVDTEVSATLARMRDVAEAVRSGRWRGASGRPISDVVHVGIGGSQLGPQLACEALAGFAHRRLKIHFLGNIDPEAWRRVSIELNPATTLFIIASKSWRTPETARNAQAVRHWLVEGGIAESLLHLHLLGVSSNREAARAFGIADEHLFTCPDWVGGRYSLWGAIGLPLMISIGADRFDALLEGARAMDEHFRNAPPLANAPIMLALVSAWNARLLPGATEVVIPYSDCLRRLPAHLQQLQMESNGKSVLADGSAAARYAAMPVIWGEPGTESQHSFFQALHQGPIEHALEFILVDRASGAPDPWQRDRALLANALAQAHAFAMGHTNPSIERCHPGNRPVTLIHLPQLDPATFGALVALYEHKTVSLAWLWGINPFDQWGVERGKKLAEGYEVLLDPAQPWPAAQPPGLDAASGQSLARLRSPRVG
jgi:glucose-6-phosphate isomerase